jgi:hypothetical protein
MTASEARSETQYIVVRLEMRKLQVTCHKPNSIIHLLIEKWQFLCSGKVCATPFADRFKSPFEPVTSPREPLPETSSSLGNEV